jgi:hypothetical protein
MRHRSGGNRPCDIVDAFDVRRRRLSHSGPRSAQGVVSAANVNGRDKPGHDAIGGVEVDRSDQDCAAS